jgi:hypothetical protein
MLVGHFDEPLIEGNSGVHHRYKLVVTREESEDAHKNCAWNNPCVSWLGVSTVLPWLEGGNDVTQPGHIGLQNWLDGRDQAYFDALNAHFDEVLNQC